MRGHRLRNRLDVDHQRCAQSRQREEVLRLDVDAEGAGLAAQAKQFQIPSNVGTPVSPLTLKMADIKLINYDFAKYGLSAERKRLLEKWDAEVGAQAK